MGDCHLGITFDGDKDKISKYTLSAWCPSYEKTLPRRRTLSDSNEYRKKLKERKSVSPRKRINHENMDIEYDTKDSWFHGHDPRVRMNLCELPTSYISNNCQKPPPKIIDCIERNVKTYEQTLKFANAFDYHNRISWSPHGRKVELRQTHIDHKDILYDTGTYFDKAPDGLKERYNKEVQILKKKLLALKNNNNDYEEARSQITANKCLLKNKKKVSVKTKSRISSAKSRKLKSKMVTSKIKCRNETVYNEKDSCPSDFASDESDIEEIELPESKLDEKEACGDGLKWPIRQSLFPNMPPYIRFKAFDAETPNRMPVGRKLFKWKLSTITPIVVRKTLTNSGFILVRNSNQWMGTWGKHMQSPMFKTLKEMQKLNHFPGTYQLGRKDRLWRNFQKLKLQHGQKEFGFLPQTFILPQELKLLKQNWEYKNGNCSDTWIIKPPAAARGDGIKVINKWSQLPKKMPLVVQKYISNPYLINGSKFDLRLYVLVTSFHPLRIYLYPDGLARFASAKYNDDTRCLNDRYIHLTNYSINKFSTDYTINENADAAQGHKWTLKKLLEFLATEGVDTKKLWKNLQQLVIKTLILGEAPITNLCEENMNNLYNCYELFGIDVLLDEKLKPWLLEVNISPSLHNASPLDSHVKGPMVQTLFDLVQFHLPSKLLHFDNSPSCYDPKLYTSNLTYKERNKHNRFECVESRYDYLNTILNDLTGDDLRRLIQAEDEYVVKGNFQRIFPTSETYKYLEFMENRYYNHLFDAWETKYENNRNAGINLLRELCARKLHLKIATTTSIQKNGLSTNNLVPKPSTEGSSRPLDEILQQVSIQI